MQKRPLTFLLVLLMSSPLSSQLRPLGTEHVQARGCVRPTKQEGCFTLHDISQHRFYDLQFDPKAEKPDLYTHISFEGIGFSHDALCSTGRPVHVSSWKVLPGECSRPAPANSKPK